MFSGSVVWAAPCAAATRSVHIHLGDGEFVGLLDGPAPAQPGQPIPAPRAIPGRRGRRPDGASGPGGEFETTGPRRRSSRSILSDVAPIPPPRWRDAARRATSTRSCRARAARAAALRLGRRDGADRAVSDGSGNQVPSIRRRARSHGPLRVILESGDAPLSTAGPRISFTDGSGEDREVFLPAVALAAGQTAPCWISETGGAFADVDGRRSGRAAWISALALNAPPVPWAVQPAGIPRRACRDGLAAARQYRVRRGSGAGGRRERPFLLRHGALRDDQAWSRATGAVSDYATDLLNFGPTGGFPGSGEKGSRRASRSIPCPATSSSAPCSRCRAQTDFHFPEVAAAPQHRRRPHGREPDRRSSSSRTSRWARRTRPRTSRSGRTGSSTSTSATGC